MSRLLALPLALLAAIPAFAQEPGDAKPKPEPEKIPEGLKADQEVLIRQLEVQLAQIQELAAKIEQHRAQLAKATNEKNLLAAEAQYARAASEQLQKDLSALEEKHVALAREKKQLEDKERAAEFLRRAEALYAAGDFEKAAAGCAEALRLCPDDPKARAMRAEMESLLGRKAGAPPRKPLEGKVLAVASEIDLVVLSLGAAEGVREGDEFSLYREGDFVAKVIIDRSDRKWSAGKVTLKKRDPRVADDVSNHVFVSAPRAAAPDPVSPKSAETLKDIRKELDQIRKQVRELSGQLYPAWAVAGVYVEEAPDELRTQLAITDGLVVKAIRLGSAADKAGLKVHDVIPRWTEARLLEAIDKGEAIGIVRQGKPQTLGGR